MGSKSVTYFEHGRRSHLESAKSGRLRNSSGLCDQVGNLSAGQTIADTPALPVGGSTEFFIGLASTLAAKVCARVDVSDTVIEADEGNNYVCASLVN